ncbi:diacylglycerol kinase family protein [Arthrobacter sp. SDTb3-6]|uniref:diacylglycerol/lipid kinase family protein n=1 Tax=Arthrobacter sp. SDTb3-6 TaxID=2713571 RepID=UPI00159D018D|nr:diacylglycerol kinase family protein [Arthrobacter sp. SDTb3-6]NVM99832.1 diacylglycerol kinase family lipid kinase [Arthrobacter sp. SDTb3-6]
MTQRNNGAAGLAAVVINPVKSPGDGFRDEFQSLCREEGWGEPLWLETTEDDPGAGQAREALEAGADVVIAAGGDGTVRCVAEVLAGTGVAMGLLPLGTGNLLARNLGIDVADPLGAARGILAGRDITIDVVRAHLDHSDQGQLFLVMAGLGYDAAIMANTVDGLKDRIGWLAYVEAGMRQLPGRPVRARISIDGGREVRRRIRSVMVGNCGQLMGGVEMFPDARIDDGVLDLVALSPRGRLGWLGVLAGVFGPAAARNRSVDYLAGKSAAITLAEAQEFQLDGDHLGSARHLRVAVEPGALTIRTAARQAGAGAPG